MNTMSLIAVLMSLMVVASSCAAQEETGAGDQDMEIGGRKDDVPVEVSRQPQGKSAIDPKDERQIVGQSEHVFFGWVVERSGSEGAPTSKPGHESPQTQYTVEVTGNIKGDASGTVTVNQIGGYVDDGHEDHKHLDLVEGDELLEPGREYLLATNYAEEKGWYQIMTSGGYANVEVEDEAHREELERTFEEAEADQVKVNVPGEPPSLEEREKRTYRPCWPDGKTPPGWKEPCDPSDPLPPGKSK